MGALGGKPRLQPKEPIRNNPHSGWGAHGTGPTITERGVFSPRHTGTWDMAAAPFAARGRTVSALVEPLKPARWNERVQRTRIAAGVKAIPIESGLREMIAALRRREGLAVLVDRPSGA